LLHISMSKVAEMASHARLGEVQVLFAVTLGGGGTVQEAAGMVAESLQPLAETETEPPSFHIALSRKSDEVQAIVVQAPAFSEIAWSVTPQSASDHVPLHATSPSLHISMSKVAEVASHARLGEVQVLFAVTLGGSGMVQISVVALPDTGDPEIVPAPVTVTVFWKLSPGFPALVQLMVKEPP
jgi:hypothetical protein